MSKAERFSSLSGSGRGLKLIIFSQASIFCLEVVSI